MRACCASWRPSAATSRTSRPQRGTQSMRTSLCPAAMMAASATGSSPTPTSPRQAALRSHPLCYLATILGGPYIMWSEKILPHDVPCGNIRAFLQSATPRLFRDDVWLFPQTRRHMQFPCASMSAGSCGDRSAFLNNLYFVIKNSPRCSMRRCSVVSRSWILRVNWN